MSPSQRSNRQTELDPQMKKNYQIADRIANQFAQEEELRRQQQQQQQPKQIPSRFDSYNNSFNAGLDGQPQQQQQIPVPRSNNSSTNNIQNSNLYSISTGNGNGNGNGAKAQTKKPSIDEQSSIDSQAKKLPPMRPKVEFPKAQQQQQPPDLPPQPNRKFSNRSQEVSDPNFGSDCKCLV